MVSQDTPLPRLTPHPSGHKTVLKIEGLCVEAYLGADDALDAHRPPGLLLIQPASLMHTPRIRRMTPTTIPRTHRGLTHA
jgi:hypothetical protein